MLTLSGVAKAHGLRTLFRDVSLQVVPGRRIALVGANGVGKTTLLEIMSGDQRADAGQVTRARGAVVGYLPQDVAEAAGRPVLAEVLAAAGRGTGGGRPAEATALEQRMRVLEAQVARARREELDALLAEYGRAQERYEQLGGYGLEAEARRVLGGLGFADADLDRDVGELSGGWMMRVALARLLLAGPDVLLLDEPTNHLDLASVSWLESFLGAYQGAVVLTSHDRDFINTIANRVLEIAHATATEYVGNYADFVEARAQRMEQLQAAARNTDRKVAETERFIERFRYKASKARQVQSRVKQLERLERVEAPDDSPRALRFRFPPPSRSGRDVLRLEGVVKRYGDHTVYDGLDLVLERGRKVALVGPNGAGKSTLLKILAGVLPVEGGRRVPGHNVSVAYFAQHQVDALDPDSTVLAELSAAVDTAKVNPRSMLGAFLFSGDDVDKRVGVLSGGEKSRLALAKMLANPANLLCMDEPTNHLDIASRDVLEDALVAYPGTVVLITHDRHLIRSVADTIVEVAGGTARLYPGDYDYYVDKTGHDTPGQDGPAHAARGRDRSGAQASADEPAARGKPARRAAADKRAEAERRNRLYRETRELRERLTEVEEDLAAAEADVAELNRQLADPAVYDDSTRVTALIAAHDDAKERAATLTAEWERAYLAVEEATARVSSV
ncbi:MAG TPA: ABC-F family ATP-binding cassette domain-containing protein [Egibacteraceae bacterium]|nr:ABC-F family ATP-binding cassette domain-containing protein [Egibacteraceae bacterium]